MLRYGYKKILRPLVEDLKKLETDDGVKIKLADGTWLTLRAVLCHVLGDTLAMHEIFELMGPGATLFCRACYANRKELRSGKLGDLFPHRTKESVQRDLEAVQQGIMQPRDCGILRECALHELKHFHLAVNNTFDPMHDLLEGVVKLIIKLILNVLVNVQKIITEDELNKIVAEFDYGIVECRDKPSVNFKAAKLKARGSIISQSAAQTWLLLRAFPFMFNQFLQSNPRMIAIISCLLKITYYSFSNKLRNVHIDDLDLQICRFHELFSACFPNTSPINKIHHISHYPEAIRKDGPVALYSCMLFENKFRESKALSKTCGNFNNFTYSLTKRLNLRQVRSILNYNYSLDKLDIISSQVVRKEFLEFSTTSTLFDDLPESVAHISHCKINSTSFRPGVVCRYILDDAFVYGIIRIIIALDHGVIFIIESLECEEFAVDFNALKVKKTGIISRIEPARLLTRKTYSLWTILGDPTEELYFSLKYNDW